MELEQNKEQDCKQQEQQNILTTHNLIMDHRFSLQIAQYSRQSFIVSDIPVLASDIASEDIIRKHRGAIGIRRILSLHSQSMTRGLIDSQIIRQLINIAKSPKYPHLRLESASILATLLSRKTHQSNEIIRLGGVPLFVKLLKSKKMKIMEVAIWGVGNLSSQSPTYRNMILDGGGIKRIVNFAKRFSNKRLIKGCCWAISNLCRGVPLPRSEETSKGIIFLCRIIGANKIRDKDILADCFWAIFYHIYGLMKNFEVIAIKLIPTLLEIFTENYSELSIICPIIRTLGQLSTQEKYTSEILRFGAISLLQKSVKHQKKFIRRYSCWSISNIAAGKIDQVNLLISQKNLFEDLISLLDSDSSDVKREVCFIFSNITFQGDPSAVIRVYKQHNLMNSIKSLLGQEVNTVRVIIECLYRILSFVNRHDKSVFGQLIDSLKQDNVIDALERIQCFQQDDITQCATKILKFICNQRKTTVE